MHLLSLVGSPERAGGRRGDGLRTAYIGRAGEGTPEPTDTFDLTAPDLAALAARLLAAA